MAQEEPVALSHLLTPYQAFITYRPLRTEVVMQDVATLPAGAEIYEIPARASLDPIEEANKVTAWVSSRECVLLIPGRMFDASGTRHGQGGGWYDRFLALVPREWLRIGFCYSDQFSPTPLKRERWDQAMDYVCVVDRTTGKSTLYGSDGATPS